MSISVRWCLLPLGVALVIACGDDPPPKAPSPTSSSSTGASGGGGNTGEGGDEGGNPSNGGGPVTSANGGNAGGPFNQGGDTPGCLHCADTLTFPPPSGDNCNSSAPITSAFLDCMCFASDAPCKDECTPNTCINGMEPNSGCQTCIESDCSDEYNACLADDGN